jgi:hypothetical protein
MFEFHYTQDIIKRNSHQHADCPNEEILDDLKDTNKTADVKEYWNKELGLSLKLNCCEKRLLFRIYVPNKHCNICEIFVENW